MFTVGCLTQETVCLTQETLSLEKIRSLFSSCSLIVKEEVDKGRDYLLLLLQFIPHDQINNPKTVSKILYSSKRSRRVLAVPYSTAMC